MKVISTLDLLTADSLQGMNMFDLCHLDNLEKVNAVLEAIGFDIHGPIEIYAAQHRRMNNEVVIGYLFAGNMSMQRKHLAGPYSTLADRMIAASLTDVSLFEELYGMGHRCHDYGDKDALDDGVPAREVEEIVNEQKAVEDQIAQLEDILYHIRGSQRKLDGSIKTAWDYKNPEEPPKKRKKKVKKLKENE